MTARAIRASNLHISVGRPIFLRLNDGLRFADAALSAADLGMQLMDDSIARIHELGLIDGREAYLKTFNKERFQQ